MKRQIRKGVFETNSSSTHSFTVGNTFNNLLVNDYDNCVHTELGEFGWEIEDYFDSASKLAYILLVAGYFNDFYFDCYSNSLNENIEKLYNTEEFRRIEDAVKNHIDCEGIVINDDSHGYIDHQSIEYESFGDWLYDTGASDIEDFIFGNIVLHTDNDNH